MFSPLCTILITVTMYLYFVLSQPDTDTTLILQFAGKGQTSCKIRLLFEESIQISSLWSLVQHGFELCLSTLFGPINFPQHSNPSNCLSSQMTQPSQPSSWPARPCAGDKQPSSVNGLMKLSWKWVDSKLLRWWSFVSQENTDSKVL